MVLYARYYGMLNDRQLHHVITRLGSCKTLWHERFMILYLVRFIMKSTEDEYFYVDEML